MIKTTLLWLLAAISIFSCSTRQELKNINPPLGLKWNMSMDEVKRIADKRNLKYDKFKQLHSDPPEYVEVGIRGKFSDSYLLISCFFWSDSLYGFRLNAHGLNFNLKSKLHRELLNKTLRHNIENSIQIDTIEQINKYTLQGTKKISSHCMALDSSRLEYEAVQAIGKVKDYKEVQSGVMRINGPNYFRFKSYINKYRIEAEKESRIKYKEEYLKKKHEKK